MYAYQHSKAPSIQSREPAPGSAASSAVPFLQQPQPTPFTRPTPLTLAPVSNVQDLPGYIPPPAAEISETPVILGETNLEIQPVSADQWNQQYDTALDYSRNKLNQLQSMGYTRDQLQYYFDRYMGPYNANPFDRSKYYTWDQVAVAEGWTVEAVQLMTQYWQSIHTAGLPYTGFTIS